MEKKCAYKKNGNVFFDVTSFPEYGRLSGNTLENLKVGARLEAHPDKKNPWDFALWLSAPKEHLLKWESPWSLGYPGWHIECSAMSTEYLGDTLDIHTGGEDNIFPHHEAEIAQTECYTGNKFVHYWVHNRHLLVDGEKMSKSKGNFYILEDIEKKGYTPMELRLALLSSHYRTQMNFTWSVMEQAKNNLQRIYDWLSNLKIMVSVNIPTSDKVSFSLGKYQKEFEDALEDDLNTPIALSVLYKIISETNKHIFSHTLSTEEAGKILSLWKKMNKVFGLVINVKEVSIPDEIWKLAEKRTTARKEKDFKTADKIRQEINKHGYNIKDMEDDTFILEEKRED